MTAFVTSLWLSFPLPGGWTTGRSCSCPVSGAKRMHFMALLCQRLPPSCRAKQPETRLLKLWRWFSKTLWGFESWVFWGNMRGIQIVDITLTSPAVFQHCFQSKKKFHFTGMWSCQVWSLVFSFAYQSQKAFLASVLLSLLLWAE